MQNEKCKMQIVPAVREGVESAGALAHSRTLREIVSHAPRTRRRVRIDVSFRTEMPPPHVGGYRVEGAVWQIWFALSGRGCAWRWSEGVALG